MNLEVHSSSAICNELAIAMDAEKAGCERVTNLLFERKRVKVNFNIVRVSG